MQNSLSPSARWSGVRGSGTNAKFSYIQPLVVVVRTQNSLSSAARGSSARGSGTNEKFSYVQPRVLVVRVVVLSVVVL